MLCNTAGVFCPARRLRECMHRVCMYRVIHAMHMLHVFTVCEYIQKYSDALSYINMLMRDEKEGRKKQSNNNATQHTQGSHFSNVHSLTMHRECRRHSNYI